MGKTYNQCKVICCRSAVGEKRTFQLFPTNLERANKWIDFCRNPVHQRGPIEKLTYFQYVCNDHFSNLAFTNHLRQQLRHDAIPTRCKASNCRFHPAKPRVTITLDRPYVAERDIPAATDHLLQRPTWSRDHIVVRQPMVAGPADGSSRTSTAAAPTTSDASPKSIRRVPRKRTLTLELERIDDPRPPAGTKKVLPHGHLPVKLRRNTFSRPGFWIDSRTLKNRSPVISSQPLMVTSSLRDSDIITPDASSKFRSSDIVWSIIEIAQPPSDGNIANVVTHTVGNNVEISAAATPTVRPSQPSTAKTIDENDHLETTLVGHNDCHFPVFAKLVSNKLSRVPVEQIDHCRRLMLDALDCAADRLLGTDSKILNPEHNDYYDAYPYAATDGTKTGAKRQVIDKDQQQPFHVEHSYSRN